MANPFATGPNNEFNPPGVRNSFTTTISSGQSLSSAIDLGSSTLFAIQMPAAWTTAANITFQASYDGVTYCNMYDSNGTEMTVTGVAASEFIVLALPTQWIGVRFLKIRSGTSGTPVSQGADRVLGLISVL